MAPRRGVTGHNFHQTRRRSPRLSREQETRSGGPDRHHTLTHGHSLTCCVPQATQENGVAQAFRPANRRQYRRGRRGTSVGAPGFSPATTRSAASALALVRQNCACQLRRITDTAQGPGKTQRARRPRLRSASFQLVKRGTTLVRFEYGRQYRRPSPNKSGRLTQR